MRATVTAAASYDPADRYVLFELGPTEVRCNGYRDVALPECSAWHTDRAAPPDNWRHDDQHQQESRNG